MQNKIYPVILAGGASSRLWPLSDHARPKWALKLFGNESLLEATMKRAIATAPIENCHVVAGEVHAGTISKLLPDLKPQNLLIEPALRDTAAAVAFAAAVIRNIDPDGVLLILSGDQLISPVERFAECARVAASASVQERALVTFGLLPRFPATGYGYIRRGPEIILPVQPATSGHATRTYRVQNFKEKPDLETAKTYFSSGDYYWNGGIFAFYLPVLLDEFQRQLPGHFEFIEAQREIHDKASIRQLLLQHYPTLEKKSIDFGIMEHAENIATVACDFDWDDIGSWSAVRDNLIGTRENATGPGTTLECIDAQRNLVFAPNRRVALLGLKDVAVVDDPEGLLICALSHDQVVKRISAEPPEIKVERIEIPSQERSIQALIAYPPFIERETGLLLMCHGMGGSAERLRSELVYAARHYNLVAFAPEYRGSGLDVDPSGQGIAVPYDMSHLQTIDCLNAYQAVKRYLYNLHTINLKRSFVWGSSQGGQIANLCAAFAPQTFGLSIALNGVGYVSENFNCRRKIPFTLPELEIRDVRRWAERIRCPVILIHGLSDNTVPPEHSSQVAQALLRHNHDVTVRFLPGVDHDLRPFDKNEVTRLHAGQAFMQYIRTTTRDDFDANAIYTFDCSNGVCYSLKFAQHGIATIGQESR